MDEERLKLLESNEQEVCVEILSDVEQEIRRRSGVDGFFHDSRVRVFATHPHPPTHTHTVLPQCTRDLLCIPEKKKKE